MARLTGLTAALARRTALASAVVLLGFGAARAQAQPDLVDLSVVDRDTGQTLPVWRRDGRLFVAGEQGERYSLRLSNHTDGRVLVVLSVDGVNIISGETAGYNGRGYILRPYQTADIRGWRKSETEIAAFSFTALPDSYAAETGRPSNVGVIGMAVFRERPRPAITPLDVTPAPPPPPRPPAAPPPDGAPPPPLPIPPVEKPIGPAAKAGEPSAVGSGLQRRDAVPAAPEARRQADEKLGTAHGALEHSVSHVMPFVRATPYPQLVRQIEYDSSANLIRIGVIPSPPRAAHPPRAFPAAPGYVPDPPGRP